MAFNYSIRIQQDNLFRLWISVAVFLICSLLSFATSSDHFLFVTLLFAIYFLIFGLSHIMAKRGPVQPFWQYALLTADCLVITLAVQLSGGLQSPLYILYIVSFGISIFHRSLSNFVFSAVLSFMLYAGFVLWKQDFSYQYLYSVLGQMILMGVLTSILYSILVLMDQEKRINQRLIARAKTLAHIADVLSGSLENSREWLRTITKMVEEELRHDGIRCRIVLQRSDQTYLPPSGGTVGLQVPIMVGEIIFGYLMVSKDRRNPITPAEQDFLSSLARSLGLSLHRAKLWEDFQTQLQKVEAKILLSAPQEKPVFNSWFDSEGVYQTVDEMLEVVKVERGKLDLSLEPLRLDQFMSKLQLQLEPFMERFRMELSIPADLSEHTILHLDQRKAVKLFGALIEHIAQMHVGIKIIEFKVSQKGPLVEFALHPHLGSLGDMTVEQPIEEKRPFEPPKENGSLSRVQLLFSQKIIEAHQGKFWLGENDTDGIPCYHVALPIYSLQQTPAVTGV